MIKQKIVFVVIFIFYTFTVHAWNGSLADPDSSATGYEFNGTAAVKVGNCFEISGFLFGGFLESRNESRFDQAVLPNHNWRGFAFAYYGIPLFPKKGNSISLNVGIEHESAHSTMGFYEHNDEAYEMVYDNYYRNINLNSILLRYAHEFGVGHSFSYYVDYQFYFLGKNTPELHNHDLTQGHGISVGIQYNVPLYKSVSAFVSVFDRYIFQSRERREGYIYFDSNGTVVQRSVSYPIINNVNTIVVKGGVFFNDFVADRKFSIYGKLLYGNIFGFVDSRDNRLVFSGGIEIVQ